MSPLIYSITIRHALLMGMASMLVACSAAKNQPSFHIPNPLASEKSAVDSLNAKIQSEHAKSAQHAFLGIGHSVSDVSHLTSNTVNFGYKVTLVLPDSAAHRAGIKQNDYIIRFDDLTLDDYESSERHSALKKYLMTEKLVGDTLGLSLIRSTSLLINQTSPTQILNTQAIHAQLKHPGYDKMLLFKIDHTVKMLALTAQLGKRIKGSVDDLPDPKLLMPSFEDLPAPYGDMSLIQIQHNQRTSEWQDLLYRHAEDELWQGLADRSCQIDVFRYLRLRPTKVIAASDKISNDLLLNDLPLNASQLLLNQPLNQPKPIQWQLQTLNTIGNQLVHHINAIGQLRDKAFSALNTSEVRTLAKLSTEVSKRFSQSFYISQGNVDEQDQIHQENTQFFSLASKVNLSPLLQAAQLAQQLNNPSLHKGILKLAQPTHSLSEANHTTWSGNSSYGKVIIGGTANNEYRQPAALMIETGGDDWYIGANQASQKQKVSIIIDLSGNDRYETSKPFSLGGALMAISMLSDRSGDDVYNAVDHSLGSAFLGVGLLYDTAGNDRYISKNYTQGTAFYGLAALSDTSGNDRYTARLYSQGMGGTCGIGVMRDFEGNDHYTALKQKPSSYGVSGHFQSASQGVGIGFRGYARGGLGALLDLQGNDTYESGNFSLGTGYFFGWGLLRDWQGNDHYTASRYGLAASAHSAIGSFSDDQGNDTYTGNHVALIGAAWDLSISGFKDLNGNDTYARFRYPFNIGASAHNSYSIMVDRTGADRYSIQGPRVPSNDYHGGWSFAFRYDLEGHDSYHLDGKNNALTHSETFGFAADFEANEIVNWQDYLNQSTPLTGSEKNYND